MRFVVRVLDKQMRRDLRYVRGPLTRTAHTRAMNFANGKARTFLIRNAQSALGLKNQKALRRQIRIPKTFRATKNKANAGGVYGAFVPRALFAQGEEVIFLNRKPRSGVTVSASFSAKMKSGHSGIFVRVINDPKRKIKRIPRETPKRLKWGKSELPIYEQFTNALQALHPIAQQAVAHAAPFYEKEFARQQKLLLKTKVRSV